MGFFNSSIRITIKQLVIYKYHIFYPHLYPIHSLNHPIQVNIIYINHTTHRTEQRNIHQEANPWLSFGPWSRNHPPSARPSLSPLSASGTRPSWAAPRPASCHRTHPSTRNAYHTQTPTQKYREEGHAHTQRVIYYNNLSFLFPTKDVNKKKRWPSLGV